MALPGFCSFLIIALFALSLGSIIFWAINPDAPGRQHLVLCCNGIFLFLIGVAITGFVMMESSGSFAKRKPGVERPEMMERLVSLHMPKLVLAAILLFLGVALLVKALQIVSRNDGEPGGG